MPDALNQGRIRQHRSGHQSYVQPDPTQSTRQRRVPYPKLPVDPDDQEERWTGQSDAEPQLPNALAHASPEVKAALANVNDNTRAMAAAVYHENHDQNLASLDRLVLQLICTPPSSVIQPTPRSASDNLVLASNPTVRTHSSSGDVASRRPRDLTLPPHERERRKTATRRWLRQCSEHFRLEALLNNINTTDEQRVALATTWLEGLACMAVTP
ncbi:hypothetical protein KEM55_008716 [Ascosphaera atra]|nr:hypothetical protein KEM55_008716 [Ascosphaera atra]